MTRTVTREQWAARPRRAATYQPRSNVNALYLHYTAAHSDLSGGPERVRGIQRYHMESNGWSDIGYTDLVNREGVLYEGRGKGIAPASQAGFNFTGRSLAFLGGDIDGRDDVTDAGRLAQGEWIRGQFKDLGREVPVRPHSSVNSTRCPGDEIRAWIRTRGWELEDKKPRKRRRPKWFFRWYEWLYGEGRYKGAGKRAGDPRPEGVPRAIRPWVWAEARKFRARQKHQRSTARQTPRQ